MSIPPYSAGRGCSANFALPVREEDVLEAQRLVETVDRVNRFVRNPPLREIVYRGDDYEFDVRRPVYRWNTRPYQEVFANGFRAPPQGNTPNSTYYDLQDYVQNAGAPLDANRPIPRAFVSTTLSNTWTPTPSLQTLPQGGQIQLYRYEIYAPGGIWVRVTLGNQYDQYSSQAEVTFVGGIAPQYIRSAQIYTATRTPGSRFVRMNREERLILNGHFRPSLDVHFIIVVPLSYYLDDDRVRRFLPVETFTPGAGAGLMKREVLSHGFQDDDELEWYRYGVVDVPIYINAAFRSSRKNEAYIFMNDEYALMNYAPGTKNDRIVNGPLLICDGFPSLIGTPFGEHGIDCAFDTDYNEAYIFSGNLCAYIDYAPGTTDDKILSGPMSIRDMFPCLKGTVCETGIDTAFRSSKSKEAYLFSGGQYVILNYASKTLVHSQIIRNGYPCLVGTIFETGIEAAFASHRTNEAYIFKGAYYALMNFAPGTTDDYLLGSIKPILPHWPSLQGILPRKNGRFDFINHEARPQQSNYQYDL